MSNVQIEEQIKDFGSKFDLHPQIPEGTAHSFAAEELIHEGGMKAFVECYRPLIKGLDDKVAGSYFAGALGYVALAVQYSLSVYSQMPEIRLSNLSVHLIPAERYWRVAFAIEGWSFLPSPEDASQRISWRNDRLTSFYRDTAGPLLNTLSKVTGLAAGEIWGQLPSRFNYYMESFAAEDSNKELLDRLQDDYRYLCEDMPPEVFQLPRNPFRVQVRKIESLVDPQQTVHMRNRCCLYYRTEGGSLCYTCPRLKEEERAKRRVEYRAKAAWGQA